MLKEYGSRNDEEREWSEVQVNYLQENGRVFFYKVLLNGSEIARLNFGGSCQNATKAEDIKRSILKHGYDKDSFIFLRDLNEGEVGSFYVENGKHRVVATIDLVKSGGVNINIPAVLVLRKALE